MNKILILYEVSAIDLPGVDFIRFDRYNERREPQQKEKELKLMSNEFAADLITLIDEEGVEHEFEILDVIENDDGCYYALLPAYENPEDSLEDDGTYYIFEAIDVDGEQQLAEVEDDELLDQLAEIFESRFEELYEYDDDSSEE